MKIKDKDVIQALTQDGISLDRWLAVDSHLVGYFDEMGRLMLQVLEDDVLSSAAARCYGSVVKFKKILRVMSPFNQVYFGSIPVCRVGL